MTSWLASVSRYPGTFRHVERVLVGLLVVGALTLPASATAAVTIGEAGMVGIASCNPDATWVQDSTAVGSPSYVVPPGGGVITSWSHDRGAAVATAQLRLKIFRSTAPSTYLTVGHSDFETLTAAGVNTFATRIAVEAGDHLGFRLGAAMYSCRRGGFAGDLTRATTGPDPAIGSSVSFGSPETTLLNLAATVEPDADEDGFGDETQDGCPSEVDTQGACVPPETTITHGPKDKSKKKSATFEFISSDPGSSFQCAVDGQASNPCTSPFTVKVRKGKHSFQVQATDPGGNVDGSPAYDDWKVKKKKKKKK